MLVHLYKASFSILFLADNGLQISEEAFQPDKAAASSDPSPEEESKKTDLPEYRLLDEILSRAQRIRETQPEVMKAFHFVPCTAVYINLATAIHKI